MRHCGWSSSFAIALIILLYIPHSFGTLFVSSSSNATTTEFITVSYAGSFDAFSGPMVVVDNSLDYPNVHGLNLTGKILFCTTRTLRGFWPWVGGAGSQLGLLGVVVQDGDYDAMGGLSSFPHKKPLPFPVVSVSRQTAALVSLLRNETLFAVVDDVSGPNHYMLELKTGYFWFFRVFHPISSFALFFFGMARLVQMTRETGIGVVSVMKVAVALETIGCLLRFIYWSADPLGFAQYFSNDARNVWHTIPLPFTINSTLVLTIYWHETVSQTSLKFSWSIQRFKIPTYGIFVGVFALEAIIDGFTIGWPSAIGPLPIINSTIYLTIIIGLCIFFIATATRILTRLSGSTSSSSKYIAPIAIKLIFMCVALICIVVTGMLTITDGFARLYRPPYVIYIWSSLHLFMSIKAFVTISAVQKYRGKKSGAKSTPKSKVMSDSMQTMPGSTDSYSVRITDA